MSCFYHPERNETTFCSHCGKLLCSECSLDVHGKPVCKSCIPNFVKTKEGRPNPHYSSEYSSMPYKRSSGFLTFVTSLVPGCGHMYLGLMKKGILILSLFLLSIYLTSSFNSNLSGLVIILIYIVSFFDSFSIRRKLNNNIIVEDNIDSTVSSLKKYAPYIILLYIFSFVISAFNRFYNFGFYIDDSIIGIIMLIIGGLLLFNTTKSKDKPKQNNQDDFIDKR